MKSETRLRYPMANDSSEVELIEKALLERRVILLTINDIKLRSALELATGVSWDSTDVSKLDGDGIEELVALRIAQGLGITPPQARQRVRENRKLASPTEVKRGDVPQRCAEGM